MGKGVIEKGEMIVARSKIEIDLVGQKFGKLEVISKAEDVNNSANKRKSSAWLCKCDCGNTITLTTTTLKTEAHYIRSCGCCKIVNPNYKEKRLSTNELVYWEELYNYVNYKIMCYDKSMLSKQMVLRLKGMRENKYFQDKQEDIEGIYPFEIILNTFKYCAIEIQKGLRINTFKDENHKFNYILKIVEQNLNTVYMRMKNVEKVEEKISNIDTSIFEYKGAEYKPKTQIDKKDKFKDMW